MNYLIGAFKPACNISITFSDGKTRKKVPMKKENGQTVMIPLFQSQENIAGKISIEPVQGKKVEHNGIKIELLGQIAVIATTEAMDDGGGRSASRTVTIGVANSARVSERVEQCESESLRENQSWRQRGREIDLKCERGEEVCLSWDC
ncbi:hypothetical protein CsSME_00029428 [Camellia sinensis var. sinensis]